GHRDGVRLGQPAQAARLGRERGADLRRRCLLLVDHLGERALPAGQGDHQVLIAVLGADDARLAHGQAGLPRDLTRDGCVHPAGLSSPASRAAMTGAAAPSRSSTWPNLSGPPPHGSGMSCVPLSVSTPTSPNSRIRAVSSPWALAIRRRSARFRESMARIRSYRDSQDGSNWRARCVFGPEPSWPRPASAFRASGSIVSPTCQSPVPALFTTAA